MSGSQIFTHCLAKCISVYQYTPGKEKVLSSKIFQFVGVVSSINILKMKIMDGHFQACNFFSLEVLQLKNKILQALNNMTFKNFA